MLTNRATYRRFRLLLLGLLWLLWQKNAVGMPGGKHDVVRGCAGTLLLLRLIYVDDYLLEAGAGDSEHGSRMDGGAFLDGYVNKVVVLSFVVANLCAHYTHFAVGYWGHEIERVVSVECCFFVVEFNGVERECAKIGFTLTSYLAHARAETLVA